MTIYYFLLKDNQKKIQIYDNIFSILEYKNSTIEAKLDKKLSEASNVSRASFSDVSSVSSADTNDQTAKHSTTKSSLPIMNQVGEENQKKEKIRFRINIFFIYNFFQKLLS